MLEFRLILNYFHNEEALDFLLESIENLKSLRKLTIDVNYADSYKDFSRFFKKKKGTKISNPRPKNIAKLISSLPLIEDLDLYLGQVDIPVNKLCEIFTNIINNRALRDLGLGLPAEYVSNGFLEHIKLELRRSQFLRLIKYQTLDDDMTVNESRLLTVFQTFNTFKSLKVYNLY